MLQELVQRHVDEEEDVVFPMVQQRVSDNFLMELSSRFKEEKLRIQNQLMQEEQTRPVMQVGGTIPQRTDLNMNQPMAGI